MYVHDEDTYGGTAPARSHEAGRRGGGGVGKGVTCVKRDETCEICNPKKQSVNCIAYVLKKNGKKVTIFTFLTFHVPKESKPRLANGYFGNTN